MILICNNFYPSINFLVNVYLIYSSTDTQSLWVSEEEFGMGIVELKSTASAAKSVPGKFSTSLSIATLL